MKKSIFTANFAALALAVFCVPAFAEADENAPAGATENASAAEEKSPSVLVLVEDVSGKNILKNIEAPLRAIVSARLAELGVAVCSTDFLANGNASGTQNSAAKFFKNLSPAETVSAVGADYALKLFFSAPIEYRGNDATFFARQNVSYSLFDATGRIVDSGRNFKIFSAQTLSDAQREQLAMNAAEAAADAFAEKISDGKILLKKQNVAATTGEAEFVCALETLSFPVLQANGNGTYSVSETRGNVTFPGVALRIAGIDYHLNADGSPTKISVPIGRPIFVSVEHRDILPIARVIKISKAGERVVLGVLLSDALKKRWAADALEITEALKASARQDKAFDAALTEAQKESARADKISDATAELIRGKAKFWENSGVRFTQNVSRKISHEEKTEINESVGNVENTENAETAE